MRQYYWKDHFADRQLTTTLLSTDDLSDSTHNGTSYRFGYAVVDHILHASGALSKSCDGYADLWRIIPTWVKWVAPQDSSNRAKSADDRAVFVDRADAVFAA